MKNIIYLLALHLSLVTYGQQKVNKPTQTIKTGKNVTIDLDTNNVNLELDTWNKDYVEIEAYLESDTLSKDALLEELKNWNVDVNSDRDKLSITSKVGNSHSYKTSNIVFLNEADNAMENLKIEMAELPEIEDIEHIRVLNFSKMPEIPELPELPEGNFNFQFDYNTYEKDGQSYLDKWSKQFEKKFGKAYQEKMSKWAKEITELNIDPGSIIKWSSTSTTTSSDSSSKDDKHRKSLERSQERLHHRKAELLERKAELLTRKAERVMEIKTRQKHRREHLDNRKQLIINFRHKSNNSNIKRTIKIKMPKKAKLNMNVKHGELKLSSVIEDLNANLAYSNLSANRINGSRTSINSSFSNVSINYWDAGTLQLDYVESAMLNQIKTIDLSSKSSNITINELLDNAKIIHSLGDLTVKVLSPDFTNLDATLNGSDALLNVPKDVKLIFNGKNSKLNNEAVLEKVINKSSDKKSVNVNAKFSKVYTN